MKWLLPALLAFAGQTFAEGSARQWLDNMSTALQSLNYDGTFVYLHDGKLESMRIVHQASEQGEQERLVSLAGSPREVLRDDKVVTCIMADSKSVTVGHSKPRPPFPVVPDDLDRLAPYYRLQVLEEDRMAGRQTQVVAITPKDSFRYGYRFWIDTTHHLLLKSDLTDLDGVAIEQVMFTRLDVSDQLSADALRPSLTGEGYHWTRQGDVSRSAITTGDGPRWTVGRLPAGFQMTDSQRKHMRKEGASAEHRVYSDGLATLSVYIEKLKSEADAFLGLSTMGAMNAFGAVVDDYQVTVVGEVPSATVQMVAASVQQAEAGND